MLEPCEWILTMVHDLQKLNQVTIRDTGVPPILDELVEAYASRSIYSVLDMYWGFYARILDPRSRDMTAFQTPLGILRITSLPMGFTNSPSEFQACMVFILLLRSDPTGSGRTEEGRKGESGGQLLTVHHRTRAGGTSTRTEETGDGWSRAGGSERSEEPQRDTREEQVILVLRFVATSTGDIYTNEQMRRSGIRERELSTISKVQ